MIFLLSFSFLLKTNTSDQIFDKGASKKIQIINRLFLRSAVVATLVKARRQKRVTIGLPLVSRSNPGGAFFWNCILGVALAKLRKRDL